VVLTLDVKATPMPGSEFYPASLDLLPDEEVNPSMALLLLLLVSAVVWCIPAVDLVEVGSDGGDAPTLPPATSMAYASGGGMALAYI